MGEDGRRNDTASHTLRALVYLDAFVLENGENVLENMQESQRNMLIEATKNFGDGGRAHSGAGEVLFKRRRRSGLRLKPANIVSVG
jgi:hypothetical protein